MKSGHQKVLFMAPTVSNREWASDDEEWLRQFTDKQMEICTLPFVKGEVGVTVSEASANLNKVYVSVWCCWEKSRRSFKQISVNCDEERKPTIWRR